MYDVLTSQMGRSCLFGENLATKGGIAESVEVPSGHFGDILCLKRAL